MPGKGARGLVVAWGLVLAGGSEKGAGGEWRQEGLLREHVLNKSGE